MNLSYPFKFDSEKAIEAILYIAERATKPDIFHVCKIMYFADKSHLEEFGRFICGDYYVAMDNGPVPSHIYDIIKAVRAAHLAPYFADHAKNAFAITPPWTVTPFRQPDTDILSASDMASLDKAISEYGAMPFDELKELSHDAAWHAADQNSVIPIEKIAETLCDSDDIIEYLAER